MSDSASKQLVEKPQPEARQKAEGIPVSLFPIVNEPKPATHPEDESKK